MDCPTKPFVVSALIIIVVHVMAAGPGMALKLEPTGTITHIQWTAHIPPILDCAPGPAGEALSDDLSAFRGNVLALLGALPAVAAAAPTGFAVATAQSGGAVGDDDPAFARAFCFGFGDCLECLSAAAQDVADGCHGRHRGAVWRAGCFLAYADTNASTAREDAWRGWLYDDSHDDRPTVAALGACVGNGAAAECSRCLNESAQVVPALREARHLSLLHRDVVVVVGYSCYLRVPLLPPTKQWVTYAIFDVVVVMLIEIGGILYCIRIARHQFNPAA